MGKPPRARTLRRNLARAADKLGDQRERLAALEAGGSPERPLEVVSSAVIEVRALRDRCLRCDGRGVLVADRGRTRAASGQGELRVLRPSAPALVRPAAGAELGS